MKDELLEELEVPKGLTMVVALERPGQRPRVVRVTQQRETMQLCKELAVLLPKRR